MSKALYLSPKQHAAMSEGVNSVSDAIKSNHEKLTTRIHEFPPAVRNEISARFKNEFKKGVKEPQEDGLVLFSKNANLFVMDKVINELGSDIQLADSYADIFKRNASKTYSNTIHAYNQFSAYAKNSILNQLNTLNAQLQSKEKNPKLSIESASAEMFKSAITMAFKDLAPGFAPAPTSSSSSSTATSTSNKLSVSSSDSFTNLNTLGMSVSLPNLPPVPPESTPLTSLTALRKLSGSKSQPETPNLLATTLLQKIVPPTNIPTGPGQPSLPILTSLQTLAPHQDSGSGKSATTPPSTPTGKPTPKAPPKEQLQEQPAGTYPVISPEIANRAAQLKLGETIIVAAPGNLVISSGKAPESQEDTAIVVANNPQEITEEEMRQSLEQAELEKAMQALEQGENAETESSKKADGSDDEYSSGNDSNDVADVDDTSDDDTKAVENDGSEKTEESYEEEEVEEEEEEEENAGLMEALARNSKKPATLEENSVVDPAPAHMTNAVSTATTTTTTTTATTTTTGTTTTSVATSTGASATG